MVEMRMRMKHTFSTRRASKRKTAVCGDRELTEMWAERKKGGEKFSKSPTYKCYGTSRKKHAMRKEAHVRTSDNIDVSGTYCHRTSGKLMRKEAIALLRSDRGWSALE